ncbi:MAG: HAMP domain-containing protein [Anaerolineae bacterium]|nr:HAMP domain-containing protein [Anaerolineae bacterium]
MNLTLRLTPKVTLSFVLFGAGLLILVGILAYTNGRQALEAATFSDLLSVAIEKEATLESWIAAGQTQIAGFAQSPFIQTTVSVLRSQSGVIAQAAHDRLVAELRPLVGSAYVFTDLMVLEPESGKIIASTNPAEEGKFKEDRLYFINGRIGPYVQNIYYSLECGCPAMRASAPIRSPDGELRAVLAGQMNLEQMGQIIKRAAGLRQSFDAFLVNTANLLVTQPNFISDPVVLQRGIRTQAVGHCLTGNSGSVLSEDYRNVPVMVIYRWLPERALCMIVKVDQAEAFASIEQFGRTLLLTGIAALVIVSILAIALARTITRPILALKEAVTRFAQGEVEMRFPEHARDELGALGHEFNTMAGILIEKETLLQDYAKDLERRVVERTSQLTFLADASRTLSESFDYAVRLKQVAQLTVPKIADWCSVDILDGEGILQRLAVIHTDPRKIELAYDLQKRFPPDPNVPVGTYAVIRTGQSQFVPEITEEMLTASIQDEEILGIMHELGLRSSMTVPLMAHGRALGTMTLVMAESGRHYDENDLALAEDLGRRAGLLIDNAKLYHETQQLNADLEKRVTERTSQLMATNRELEAFSYSVSHDLRAPLRALDGFSQALEEDYEDKLDEDGRGYLARIRAGSQRMGQLIDDLLELSRLTRSEMRLERVDLSALVHQIVADLRIEYPNHPVDFQIEDGLVVTGDTRLLRIALINLLGNAWKYTGKQPQPKVVFGTTAQDGHTIYFVQDNGAGFDMAYADKLFGVFQRLHSANEFPGNGVGLATVHRIFQRHGGQTWAEAAPDKGATFYFSLEHIEDTHHESRNRPHSVSGR